MRGVRAAGDRIDHHLAIAVVGGDNHRSAPGLKGGKRPAKPGIDHLTSLDGGGQAARVAHHVRIGEVDNDQVKPPLNRADKMVGNLGRTHLWLQIIGGHLGRGGHRALFAVKGHFPPAIQEKGDVGVFLGFSQPELTAALFCHPFAKAVDDHPLRKSGGHIGIVTSGILHHPQHRRPNGALSGGKTGEIGLAQRGKNLTRAVGAEVQAEQPIPIPRASIPLAQGQRLDLLVQIPPEGGAFAILAQVENAVMQTGVILATEGAQIAKVPDQAATPAPLSAGQP